MQRKSINNYKSISFKTGGTALFFSITNRLNKMVMFLCKYAEL